MTKPPQEDEEETKAKNQQYVILNEMGDDGKNRVIYADSVTEHPTLTGWVIIKHHKKNGTKCTTTIPVTQIQKFFESENGE